MFELSQKALKNVNNRNNFDEANKDGSLVNDDKNQSAIFVVIMMATANNNNDYKRDFLLALKKYHN